MPQTLKYIPRRTTPDRGGSSFAYNYFLLKSIYKPLIFKEILYKSYIYKI